MYRKPPVWLVFTLLLLFALTLPPRPLNAQEGTISLEQAIQTAKELFPETKLYPDFSSEFNSSPMRSTWGLRWEASADEQGNLFVEVDAHSGEIISFNQWKPEPDSNAPTSMTLSQAQGLASQWLQKLVPQKSSRLRLVSGNDVIPLNGYGNASYNFRWERVENGIPVVGEGAYMEINGRTRNIISYHLNWLETPMVDTGKAIPREQAFGVFQEQQMLKLQYFMPWEVRPLAADGNKEKLRLVYRIDHPSNGTIDALTGKPLVLKEGQWKEEMANYAMMGGMGESKRAADLTPQEISELEKNSKILSRDQAAARVKQWVDIPSQATLTSANLGRDWGNPETRVWNLNWNLNATDSSTPPFELWARVDAMSGRLYSFHLYGGEDSVPPKLDRNAAQAIADDFLGKVEPQLVGQVKLSPDPNSNTKEIQGNHDFRYNRQVNGISFPRDGMTVTVSSREHKVVGYDLTWWPQEFPAAAGAIEATGANQRFLEGAPLTLCYIHINQRNQSSQLALVYQPLPSSQDEPFAMLDAITGEKLDGAGNPLTSKPGKKSFTDISGHFAEKQIKLMGQAGLMSEFGNQFKPDQPIKNIDFLRTLIGAREGIWQLENMNDNRVISYCQTRGWLTGKIDPQELLPRQLMTQVVIRSMGLETVARRPAMFKNPFPEDSTITEANLGYVALANGLGLLHVNQAFNGDGPVTRGEVAYTLVNSLQTR